MRDDGLEILALFLEELSELVVLLNLGFSVHLDGVPFLLGLLEF
jgi:hypothetical protein